MRLGFFLAAVSLSAAALAAEPVAFVADLRGNATIEGDGKLSFLAELASGTKLLLGTGAKVAVTYALSGAEFTLEGPGEYLVSDAEVKAVKGKGPSRRTVTALPNAGVVARISQTATASLRMRGMQPPPAKSPLEYPVDTRVSSLQPVLRWQADPAVTGYVISIVDANGKEVWKGRAKPATARPAVALAPAARYSWTVASDKGALGEAHFETLPADVIARAEKSRANAKTFSGRLIHAFVLQDAGATQDAREVWVALARERPDLPELSALAR